MASRSTDHSPWWLALAGVVGAVAGGVANGIFNNIAHQRDLDAKMIELAVGILRSEPKPETTPLREWAIDVIDKRANFKFNEKQRAVLLKQELPFKGGFNFGEKLHIQNLVPEVDRPR
jgi:hypothetical protein